MAHHHHHAPPPVVEGRTGFRRRAAFIIGGLTSGHGVFHWIAQSFIVVLPEVRDLLLGGSVIAVTSIQTTREIMSGIVSLPGGVLTDTLRRYWGWVMAVCMALFGVGWILMAAAGWQAPGSAWLVSQESIAAGESSSLNPAGYALLIIGMAIVAVAASVWHLPAMAALSSHFSHQARFGPVVPRRGRKRGRRAGAGAHRTAARHADLAGDHQRSTRQCRYSWRSWCSGLSETSESGRRPPPTNSPPTR